MSTQSSIQSSSSLNLNSAVLGHDALDIIPAELEQTLKLAGLLQTSLELDTVLNYFLDAVNHLIRFDGAQFTNNEFSYEFQYGKNERHSCTYRLRLGEELLGELSFSRKKRFAEAETNQLETILCQVLYPVRNAILYKRAVVSSQVDPLTGTNNRAAFDSAIEKEVERSHRHHMPLSLAVIDIDFFKQVNDNYGHSTGDNVLRKVTEVIKDTLRASDELFRYGGEEFTVILNGTDSDGAANVAERIREEIENTYFEHEGGTIPLTVSIGISSLTTRDDAKRLFNKADAALYRAKETGRNKIHYYAKSRMKAT
ncbi:hypothetical protein MNBD_GAMMA23-979 [hydrothermal vent metagenome]|uniref:GGDEF domain-containing protein n=1 Tax=hydrothermal vent metagenome TaxID=652676 RepID=A0A3B0ZPG3_9ZZZZ